MRLSEDGQGLCWIISFKSVFCGSFKYIEVDMNDDEKVDQAVMRIFLLLLSLI